MTCDCLETKPLPMCFDSIVIGTNQTLDGEIVEVYFENQATGRIDVYLSDLIAVDGVITLQTDQTNSILLMADVTYKISLQNDFEFTPLGLLVGTTECVYQIFKDYNETYNEVTIQVV